MSFLYKSKNPMPPKIPAKGLPDKALMKERGSPRGLVPTSTYGRYDEPYNAYLAELNPQGESEKSAALRLALAASTDVRFQEFLARLSDPHYNGKFKYSLAAIAKTCDISLPQFADFWQRAQHMRTLARAQDAAFEVTGDLAADARSKMVSCDRCEGYGFIRSDPEIEGLMANRSNGRAKARATVRPRKGRSSESSESEHPTVPAQIRACPVCKGACEVVRPGDEASRKMLLEMTGHTGRRGAGVQIVQHFGSTVESAVDRLSKITFDVPDSVVDVTPDGGSAGVSNDEDA